MTKTNELDTENSETPNSRFASDFESLKGSFAQLRQDVTDLLGNTLGTGKSGAELLKARASAAVGGIEDRISDGKDHLLESFDSLGKKIGERPLLSAAIALGAGFVLARLLRSKR
jgi:ElaB/YqjD/DUF883 family membrane-anchored ribosome-binding protein